MRKTKLYRLLKTLSKRELQEFRVFLNSPYHNQSAIILALFEYIRPFHPNFDDEQLGYDNIFIHLELIRLKTIDNEQLKSNIKPEKLKKKPDEFVIDRMYDLNNRLESFLAIQYIKKNPEEKKTLFRKALLKQKCYDYFLKTTRKKIEKTESKKVLGWSDNFELWSLHHSIFSHPQTQRYDGKLNIAIPTNKYLNDAYAILKLRYTIHNLLRQEIFGEIVILPTEIKEIIISHKNSKNPVIQFYLYTISYFKNKNKDKFWNVLRRKYLQYVKILPLEEKLVFLNILINTKNKLAKAKNSIYFNEILLLYNEALQFNFWEILGEFPSITFKNIAILGASTKNISWTLRFIERYQNYISEREREDTVAYSLAYLKFYNKEFEKAERLLREAPLSKPEDKLINRSLYCRCLYELNDITLSSRLDAFLNFIKEQKLNKKRKDSYKNLIYMIKLLSRIKEKKEITKKDIELLRGKLIKRSRFIAFNWIEEKVEELELKKVPF